MSDRPATSRDTFRPILKWPGGKTREWKRLAPLLPGGVRHYVDPFMGGLAPFALTPFARHAHLNDRHPLLVDLHRRVAKRDPTLFVALDALAADWDALGPVAAALADRFSALVEAARHGDASAGAVEAYAREAARARFSDRFAELLVLATIEDRRVTLLRLCPHLALHILEYRLQALLRRLVGGEQEIEQRPPLRHQVVQEDDVGLEGACVRLAPFVRLLVLE